jgi:lantibiotic transport system permease protein
MNSLLIALRAEFLKLKRTLAFALVFLTPLLILLLQLAMYLDHAEYYLNQDGLNPWKNFNQTMLVYWSFMMLPLFITLESALIGNLEHTRHNWKLLYVQPIPRWAIYAAKWVVNVAMIALSMLVLLGLMRLGGAIVQAIDPEFGFTVAFPLGWTLRLLGLSFAAALLIISIHTWVSLRSSSFVVACATGIVATVAAVFAFGSDYAIYYPWTIPGMIATGAAGADLAICLLIGAGGGFLVALAGMWDVSRREVI